MSREPYSLFHHSVFKAAYSVTMKIFGKKYFLFKSFVKVE